MTPPGTRSHLLVERTGERIVGEVRLVFYLMEGMRSIRYGYMKGDKFELKGRGYLSYELPVDMPKFFERYMDEIAEKESASLTA